MSKTKFPHLLSPITLAGTVFRNRIFSSPTGTAYMTSQRYPIQETNAYYERKAIGGAASVCVGDAVVCSKHGRFNNGHIALDDPGALSSLSRLADSISRHGAVASIEMSHSGSHAHSSAREGNQLYGPMEYVTEAGYRVEAMTEEKIHEIIEQHAKAALFAKQCGFGMVTIHGGHGWLLTEFMSPISNQRTDRWGGSPENRCRLAVEVCKAVRRAVGPYFPIEMRISGSECNPAGYDIDEGIEIAKQLDGHLDLIHVSAGSHEVWDVFTVTHPDMFLPDGANVKYAAEIKKHVKTAVATVGALADPYLMEEIIASGQADVVEVARGLIADPDLPIKARTGREAEINKCMRCLWCFSSHITKGVFACAINPVIGQEIENKWPIQPAVKKKILVAGGGVGGMQAALTAAKRGHEVILCEKTDRLGGILRCETTVPFKARLEEYLDRQALRISRSPIDLRLSTEVTPSLAKEICPDVIIAALGARPIKPTIPGIDSSNVIGAEDLYLAPGKAGDKLVIIGGGLVGIELGVFMAARGKKVVIVEVMDKLSTDLGGLHSSALKSEIERLDIRIYVSTEVKMISESCVKCENADGVVELPADTVVYATGQKPLREEAFALSLCAGEFHMIGDCTTPKNVMDANREAYTVARSIGRL